MALSKPVSLLPDWSKSGNMVFHFVLPDGLALRSARIVDGVPELCFEASPKVPTLQEEDVATAFRLASENKRPEFFYLSFPPTHPLHQSRWFMLYSPKWLRWTKIGRLLADTDWNMKCLHVGARTNEDKTVFKSWPASSNLNGLATRLDFPEDGVGSIKMHCDFARVQKNENEIFFPEEPKMKIVDMNSSSYSKYITKILPSVAYHDEPKFLKMQELIKLVLVAEWLYKEKGVEVNHEWMMVHTNNLNDGTHSDSHLPELPESKEPPKDVIPPELPEFKPPSTDVAIWTTESEMYEALATNYQIQRRYGYIDFEGAEVNIFTEDGTELLSQKCLKISIEHHDVLGKMKGWLYLPVPKDIQTTEIPKEGYLQLLPRVTDQQSTALFPVSVSTTVEDSTDEKGMKLKITKSVHRHPPFILPHFENTTILRATVDNLDFIFANEDPNTPIQFIIPGTSEAIIPGVNSWEELISELSAPQPRFWQDPFIGIGQPTANGGVSTKSFEVRNEPLSTRMVEEETEWRDNFKKRGTSLVLRAIEITNRGIFFLYVCFEHLLKENGDRYNIRNRFSAR